MLKTICTNASIIITTLVCLGADDCGVNQGDNPNKPVKDPVSIPIAVEHNECGNVAPGDVWEKLSFEVGPLTSGYKVMLAGTPSGTGSIVVDDRLEIECLAINKNGKVTEKSSADDVFVHEFDQACESLSEAGPFDISGILEKHHSVRCSVSFVDVCGNCKGSSDIWLAWVNPDAEIDGIEEVQSIANQDAFGLGNDDVPAAIGTQNFDTLRTQWVDGRWTFRVARKVFYLGLDGKSMDTGPLHNWVDSVLGANLEPMVAVSVRGTFTPGAKFPPIPVAEFGKRFDVLIKEFPHVASWGIINEPDADLKELQSGKSLNHADIAVDYFVKASTILRKCKKDGLCPHEVTLVAGEFANKSDKFWRRYASTMRSAVNPKDPKKLRAFPRIWSFHPYADVSGANSSGTDLFLTFLRSVEKDAKLEKGSLRAWLTEVGTLLYVDGKCETSAGNLNDQPQKQYDGARVVFKLNDPARVDRIYWYHFQQDKIARPWDSAMVAKDGKPRPSFCGLIDPLGTKGHAACSGQPSADQCKAD